MSRAGAVIGVTIAVGLMLLAASMVSPAAFDTVEAYESTSTSGTVTIRSGATPEQATWQRLRWMLAGVGIAAVVMVSVRQLRATAGYPFASVHARRTERQRSPQGSPFHSPGSRLANASPSSAGD